MVSARQAQQATEAWGRNTPQCILREAIEDVHELRQLLASFRISLGHAFGHAVVHVISEDGEADAVEGCLGGRQLLENLDAEPGLLHHSANASDLPFDPIETGD